MSLVVGIGFEGILKMSKKKFYYHIYVWTQGKPYRVYNQIDIESYYNNVFIPYKNNEDKIFINNHNVQINIIRSISVYVSEFKLEHPDDALDGILDDGSSVMFDASKYTHDITIKVMSEAKDRITSPTAQTIANQQSHRVFGIAFCLISIIIGIGAIGNSTLVGKTQLGISILLLLNSALIAITGRWEWSTFSKFILIVGFGLSIASLFLAG